MAMTVKRSTRSKYTFVSFFREDPKTVFEELKRKNPREAFWGVFELTLFVITFVILGILNWHYICFLLPFWYFGHCLSYLNGYYRHYGGNPDEPHRLGREQRTTSSITGPGFATVTTQNIISAQKCIGRECRRSANQIVDQQQKAGVRVIKAPHALGFLDSHMPTADLPQEHREAHSRVGCLAPQVVLTCTKGIDS